MIYFSGLDSIIESIYLSDILDNKVGPCGVFINPQNVKYLTGKTVILNMCDYPDNDIDTLVNNGCHVISRTYNKRDDIEVQPYIMRINPDIMWNGEILNELTENFDSILDKDICKYDISKNTLYFPKIYKTGIYKIEDEYHNLTALGWALQQVGINIKQSTVFENLDIIKTGKIMF